MALTNVPAEVIGSNVPADLRSAGIEYKDLLIRLNYRCFTKVRKEKQVQKRNQALRN